MRTAAAYIRVSTDDQLEYSPDSQLLQIRRYAKDNGFLLPQQWVFVEEEGRSGRQSSKRPEFLRMIAAAKQSPKPFDAILVWKYSRFARSRQDSIVYKSMLRKELGIDVISVSEYLGDDKMAIITEAIIEAMDEFYSVNLAEEVTRGMAEKARRGQPLTYAPFGYRIEDKRYLPDPVTAPLVQMIYADFLAGMGYREIVQKLDTLQVRTRFGNRMESRGVAYILQNPVYAGKIRWNPHSKSLSVPSILADGQHQALVSPADWDAAQRRIAQLKSLYPQKAKPSVRPGCEFMLRGLVRCSSCGATLVRNANSLQCNAYARGRCTVSHSIQEQKLVRWVIETLRVDFGEAAFSLHLRQPAPAANPIALLQGQIEREQSRLERVRNAYEAGIDTLEEYRQNKEKLSATLEQLRRRLALLQAQESPQQKTSCLPLCREQPVLPFLADPAVSEVEKNRLLRALIRQVRFDRQNNCIEIHYYL